MSSKYLAEPSFSWSSHAFLSFKYQFHFSYKHACFKPNVMVEWLTLLFRIREVSGSNPDRENGYPDGGSPWFSLVPLGKCRVNTLKLVNDRFLQHPSQFNVHLLSSYSNAVI
jgi:hypothetical protein